MSGDAWTKIRNRDLAGLELLIAGKKVDVNEVGAVYRAAHTTTTTTSTPRSASSGAGPLSACRRSSFCSAAPPALSRAP